jgi:hypothetical protein
MSLSGPERALTVEAALYLLIARLAFGLLPFAFALRVLRVSHNNAGGGRIAPAEADDVSRALARAARHVPFRAVCLQQAFAALMMMRRRGLAATVHFGVAREAPGGPLTAHAWSLSGDLPLTGVAAARDYTPIAAFAA